MTSRESIHELIAEAATMLGLSHVKAYEDRDAWLLAFDEETMFDIEFDSADDRLFFAGGVCEVSEMATMAMYQVLLQYNYLWTVTGGVRMALDGMPGQVVMMFELPATGLQASRLCLALSNIANSQRAWREILPQIKGGEDQGAELIAVLEATAHQFA